MNEYPEGICWDFTFTCQLCRKEIQVLNGAEQDHSCPPGPAVEISGCMPSTVAEYNALRALSTPPDTEETTP